MNSTLIRLEGASADILLPLSEASFHAYAGRLRAVDTFPGFRETLDALAGWALVTPAGFSSPEYLVRGQTDAAVWMLQVMLRRLASLDGAEQLDPGPTDGYFGQQTFGAVREFQGRARITLDGIAGPETLAALEAALAQRGNTSLTLRGADLPRIGIVCSHPGTLVPGGDGEIRSFISVANRTGCRPVLIPPCADVLVSGDPGARAEAIAQMVASLDGLLGQGGDDVAPAIYGGDHQYAESTNYARDRFEGDFAMTAMKNQIFMFGVGRAHRLWNAADQGTLAHREGYSPPSLRQGDVDLDGADPSVLRGPDGKVVFRNRVVLTEGSRLAAALGGRKSILTNSYHHQAVDQPGAGFVVVGVVSDKRTQRDTIEATERWNGLTTQFHPEAMERDPGERPLLETVGRRAWIFRMWKAHGRDVERIEERMRAFPDGTFQPSDFDWVRGDLAANPG